MSGFTHILHINTYISTDIGPILLISEQTSIAIEVVDRKMSTKACSRKFWGSDQIYIQKLCSLYKKI